MDKRIFDRFVRHVVAEYLIAMKSTKNKIALKGRDVNKSHFSSGFVDPVQTSYSRLVVRILEGRSLLASDLDTGKSDPICFVWFGSPDADAPSLEDLQTDSSVLRTKVCPVTTDPIWNNDITFPLDDLIKDLKALADMRILIFVRDEDKDLGPDGKDMISYDELGMLELFVKDFIAEGKPMKSSIVKAASWYSLKKSPGMRRVDGKIKLTLSLIFVDSDLPALSCQILPEDIDSEAENANAATTMPALLKQLKSYHKSKANSSIRNSGGFSSDGAGSPGSVKASLDGSSIATGDISKPPPHRIRSASPARPARRKKSVINGSSLNILLEDPILESSDDAASEYLTETDDDRNITTRPHSAPPRVTNRYGRAAENLDNISITTDAVDNLDINEEELQFFNDESSLRGNRKDGIVNKFPRKAPSNLSDTDTDADLENGLNNEEIEKENNASSRRGSRTVVDRVGSDRRRDGRLNKYELNDDYRRDRIITDGRAEKRREKMFPGNEADNQSDVDGGYEGNSDVDNIPSNERRKNSKIKDKGPHNNISEENRIIQQENSSSNIYDEAKDDNGSSGSVGNAKVNRRDVTNGSEAALGDQLEMEELRNEENLQSSAEEDFFAAFGEGPPGAGDQLLPSDGKFLMNIRVSNIYNIFLSLSGALR